MKALVEPRADFPTKWRVAEVVADADVFEVAPPLVWIDAAAAVTTEWTYDGATLTAPPDPPPPLTKTERLAARLDREPLVKAVLIREAASRGITLPDILAELEPHADV